MPGSTLLDSYSPERTAVGDMVLRNASRLTDVGTLSHPAAQAARNVAVRFVLGLHTVQEKMAATMSEIEIAYAGSILSSGRHAGERLAPAHYDGAPPGAGRDPPLRALCVRFARRGGPRGPVSRIVGQQAAQAARRR